jgi:uncharacterized repeat protein (TIGR03806 family)
MKLRKWREALVEYSMGNVSDLNLDQARARKAPGRSRSPYRTSSLATSQAITQHTMKRRAKLWLVALSCVVFAASCKFFGSGVHSVTAEPFPAKLSEWRLFTAGIKPNKGVIPYDLNTPLFSDYASKYRTIWMPAGTAATYKENEVFDFPVGTIITKTFAFPAADGKEKLIETRLLVRAQDGWKALPYIWNEAQTEATLELAASPVQVSFSNTSGKTRAFSYGIPNVNECAHCHENNKTLLPIGLKARNLNRDYDYAEGRANQLAYLTKIGYLQGAPAPDRAPQVPIWNDVASGSLEARARAYLDNNCAHCHQAGGVAGYTAFLLDYNETDPRKLGFCKLPNSAGFTGNRPFDIVPGSPQESILLYRMESTRAKEMMPEIGRSVVHEEGVALVREWLASLKGGCTQQ